MDHLVLCILKDALDVPVDNAGVGRRQLLGGNAYPKAKALDLHNWPEASLGSRSRASVSKTASTAG